MITLRKLASLKEGTRQRKEVLLLRELEELLHKGTLPDRIYCKGLLDLLGKDLDDSSWVNGSLLDNTDSDQWLRLFNGLRHRLLKKLGQEPADWDFTARFDKQNSRTILPLTIYLDDIRSPFNVGSIFRTAEALGVKEILLSPGTSSPRHPRALRTAMGAVDILPWRVINPQELEDPLFAMESGGSDLKDYKFPFSGTMILGSEELGVSPYCLNRAESSLGRVSIPLVGGKGSLNVSVAFGIVMNRWVELRPEA